VIYKNQKNKQNQQFLQDNAPDKFSAALCEAFISANIPLKKVNHPSIKELFLKYCSRTLPDESTLRKYGEILTY
jgi:hypothetical protein